MSRWDATCALIELENRRDERGVARPTARRPRRVACNVYSMSDAAYYAAAQAGVRPQAVLQLRACEYRGERLVEFRGVTYAVGRVERSSPDFVRITLEERTGDRGL